MALVVEDGTGLATAEAYDSVANFDTYVALFAYDVSAYTTANKEVALRIAARYVDAKFGDQFIGWRGSRTQALEWPRGGAQDADGWLLDDDVLPVEIQNVSHELAFLSFTNTLLPDVASGESGKTIERTKVGPIEISETFGSSSSQAPQWRTAHKMLRRILQPTRIMRA